MQLKGIDILINNNYNSPPPPKIPDSVQPCPKSLFSSTRLQSSLSHSPPPPYVFLPQPSSSIPKSLVNSFEPRRSGLVCYYYHCCNLLVASSLSACVSV